MILRFSTLCPGTGGRRAVSRGRAGIRLGLAVALALLAGGCSQVGAHGLGRGGPYFVPTNVQGDPTLGGIRRVVLFPLWAGNATSPEAAAALDEVLVKALQQQNRFEVVPMSRDELRRRYRAEALASTSALPHDLMSRLQRDTAADAVLFVDLTTFQAYRPLVIGFRAKLATLDIARLVWTFDQVFTGNDPAVVNSVRRHFKDSNGDMPGDFTAGVLQSPSRFGSYAAVTMFATLPPVHTVVPVVKP